LVDDVERHYAQQQLGEEQDQEWSAATYGDAPTVGFTRHRIPMLSEATGQLYEKVLRERLLPFVAKELPGLEKYLWLRSESVCMEPGSDFGPPERSTPGTPISALAYKFSPQVRTLVTQPAWFAFKLPCQDCHAGLHRCEVQEPAINRYTDGGHFPPHADQQALTLNVLLQSRAGFQGGGTSFWSEGNEPPQLDRVDTGKPAFTLHPSAGVGVVFNGTVQHAGQAVTGKGVRYVLVSSFSITNPEYVSSSTKKAKRIWISNGTC
jgi:hypothetical protein